MQLLRNLITIGFLLISPMAIADFEVSPAEMQVCKVREGRSADDLNALFQQANRWFVTLGEFDWRMATPHYRRPNEYAWDFLRMGFWPNFDEQMKGLSAFYTTPEGRQIATEYSQVLDCAGTVQFNTIQVRVEKRPKDFNQGFGHMFDCVMNEGKTPQDVAATFQKWNQYLDANKIDHYVTALFPRTGDDQMSPGAFKFLWGGLFGYVAETLAFLTQDEAQTTWANIIGESFSCEAYDRGYFFQKVSQ